MASVPFNYACDMTDGFIPDPNEHQRVGYVTAFAGLGLPQALNADLTVTNPQTGAKMTDLTPVPVQEGIEVNVYKVSVQIAPGTNQAYVLTFANSSTQPVAKAWGLVIGSPAPALAGLEGASTAFY
jgi:hypothetical protein